MVKAMLENYDSDIQVQVVTKVDLDVAQQQYIHNRWARHRQSRY